MRRHVTLFVPRKDGTKLADHLEAVVDQGGEWPEEFPLPEIPMEAIDIWDWYWDMRSANGSGFGGPEPVKYTEMEAWSRLTNTELPPGCVRLLRVLDMQYVNSRIDVKQK